MATKSVKSKKRAGAKTKVAVKRGSAKKAPRTRKAAVAKAPARKASRARKPAAAKAPARKASAKKAPSAKTVLSQGVVYASALREMIAKRLRRA